MLLAMDQQDAPESGLAAIGEAKEAVKEEGELHGVGSCSNFDETKVLFGSLLWKLWRI
jgi:hypothetical protein